MSCLHRDEALKELQFFTSHWPKAGPPDMATQPPVLTEGREGRARTFCKKTVIGRTRGCWEWMWAHCSCTWLVFVPVGEGERRVGDAGQPTVLRAVLRLHQAHPIVRATVCPTFTQQAIDEGLLKPAGRSGQTCEEALVRANPSKDCFPLARSDTCSPRWAEDPGSSTPSWRHRGSVRGWQPCSRNVHNAPRPETFTVLQQKQASLGFSEGLLSYL